MHVLKAQKLHSFVVKKEYTTLTLLLRTDCCKANAKVSVFHLFKKMLLKLKIMQDYPTKC